MEPEGLLPDSQVPVTCSYPEPARSIPYSHVRSTTSRRSILIFSSHPSLVSQVVSFPQVSPPKPVYASPLPHTRYMSRPSCFLDSVTRTVLGEEYRSLSSSLCSFLHFLVTSSLLGPNTLLNALFSNILSLRFTFSVSDQVLHTYNKQEKLYFSVS